MGPLPSSLPDLLRFFIPKLFFSIVCGGLIGIERELKNKPAGMKTNILICMGSTLYTAVSIFIANSMAETGHYGDPSRVAAQIVSGIGFLGGGSIIQSRGTVQGLTTAATIWVVAALGILIGIGQGPIACVGTVFVLVVLVTTNWFEDRVLGRSLNFRCEVIADDPKGEVRLGINQSLAQNNLVLDDFTLSSQGQHYVFGFRYMGHRMDHKKFVLDLWNIPGIKEVRQT